jgi:hypothetical protein
LAFNYNYKPIDYKTAQGQAAKQVDPLYQRAIQGVNQQKYQSDVQAGQVAASRGLGHSGLAADQLNKIAIAAQGQVGDINAQRATQVAQMANDTVQQDKQYSLQNRAQLFGEYSDNRNFGYQQGRDKVGDSQWKKTFDYNKSTDNRNFNYQKSQDTANKAWQKYTYNNMSASDKAQLDWAKKQYGEDAAWRMYELKYNGNIQKSTNQAQIDAYTP